MEWTPEAVKAEVDYRQHALREDARNDRLFHLTGARERTWWYRMSHRQGADQQAA
jgi:hypothetical protein